MNLIYSVLIGYFLGAFPTAYIILKITKGINITDEGSGNVGTLNSYEVTNSRWIGASVLIIDFFKGLGSVLIIKLFIDENFLPQAVSLISAVFGHCYSIWIKFKGGRGLATAAGGMFILSPIVLLFWLTAWYISYKIKKDIHLSNILATIIVGIISAIFPTILNKFTFPPADQSFIFGFSLSLLMLIIFSKHLEPLKIIIKRKRKLK